MTQTHTLTVTQHTALTELLDLLTDQFVADDVGRHLSWTEADRVIALLRAFERADSSIVYIWLNGDADERTHYATEGVEQPNPAHCPY